MHFVRIFFIPKSMYEKKLNVKLKFWSELYCARKLQVIYSKEISIKFSVNRKKYRSINDIANGIFFHFCFVCSSRSNSDKISVFIRLEKEKKRKKKRKTVLSVDSGQMKSYPPMYIYETHCLCDIKWKINQMRKPPC